jgi:hypothetical protein
MRNFLRGLPLLTLAALISIFLIAGSQSLGAKEEKKQQTQPSKPIASSPANAPRPKATVAASSAKPAATTAIAPPTTSVSSIIDIQRELKDILEVHRTLQARHYDDIREIQRITEQARAHQKLLGELAAVRKMREAKPGLDMEEILRLQKIRIIQDQAYQNRTSLEQIRAKLEVQEKIRAEQLEAPPRPAAAPLQNSPPASQEKPKKTPWWSQKKT